jgi:hypothetical protein
MRISEEEVWLRAYTAALSNPTLHSNRMLILLADQAIRDFNKRFPKFGFVSEENKNK